MRVLLLLLLAACASSPAPAPARAPEPLPALTFPLLDGGSWTSESARGRVLVVDVWASWCQPCKKGFPRLAALAKRPDVAVVAVSIDEDAAAMRAFLADVAIGFPVAHDAAQTLTEAPVRVARLPTVLVVDRAGQIRHRLEEPKEADYDELGRMVDALTR
jgi:cytochrome c biogenesis protein CcmG, thiol:disulfide interchange protein DsbE